MRVGGILTPIPPLAGSNDITKRWKDGGARCVVATAEPAPRVGEAVRGTAVEEIFTPGAAIALIEGRDARRELRDGYH